MLKAVFKIVLFAALAGLSYLDEKNSAKYIDVYEDNEEEEEAF